MVHNKNCRTCQLKLEQVQMIYEKRLNSLADTFLNLVNNFENNNLFRDIEKQQILDNRYKIQNEKLKDKICTFRMEYLKSVIQGILNQNQQKIIKQLEIQNRYLKNQNQYFHKIIQYHQLSQRPFDMEQNLIFNGDNFCQSEYEESYKLRSTVNNHKQKYQRKNIHKSKLISKFQSQQNQLSSQSYKANQTPQSTSFAVNLKQNGYEDLSNNCISSIDPVSQASSYPSSSNKRSIKIQQKPSTKVQNQIFAISLREQLSNLNSCNRKIKQKPYSQSKRRKDIPNYDYDQQNQQNLQPVSYKFKYLKF